MVVYQESRCICGQSSQYALRDSRRKKLRDLRVYRGIDNDGAQVGYYYFTPVPYLQTYLSRFEAQEKCNEFNDLDNVDRVDSVWCVPKIFVCYRGITEVYLNMGYIGSYYLYGKFWGKKAISGYAKFYNFKSLELYNAIEGLPNIQTCKDILPYVQKALIHAITSRKKMKIHHVQHVLLVGQARYRVVCQKCLLGGACAGVPSESMTSSCSCPQGSEHFGSTSAVLSDSW